MANYENFYSGSEYPFEKPYGGFMPLGSAYSPSAKDIAYPTDPLTANQLKKVSDKISTGAQTIEVSGLGLRGGGPMKHLASIPRQHWKEIDRLRKLTGVELTFHGPLVEPTGVSGREKWTEDQRKESETQMMAAVELAQQMNSDDKEKGMVMTFHSSVSLPEVKHRIKVGTDAKGNPIEEVVQFGVVNERTGDMGPINLKPEYFERGGKKFATKGEVNEWLKNQNEEQWSNQISNLTLEMNRSRAGTSAALARLSNEESGNASKIKEIQKKGLNMYNYFQTNPGKVEQELIAEIKNKYPDMDSEIVTNVIRNTITNLSEADTWAQQTYIGFKEAFDGAYQKAEISQDKGTIKKLDKIKENLSPIVQEYKRGDKSKLLDFQNELTRSIQELHTITPPKFYRSLEEFAVDKASETFSNVALHAFANAKKNGIAPGIISIENPPAGSSGLTRADEIVELIEASRKKFVEKAVEQKILSKEEAEKKAKQIIGATWDVGHINSIRKWGYGKEDVIGEAKKIGPYVKHMHIADNLGFEDAELPIGMGNVPIAEILASNENFRKAKKAIETGDWFSQQGGLGIPHTPVRESLAGLTVPVYAMGEARHATYWNQAMGAEGGYSGGLGAINPEVHHSIYGGGFSGLPAYLGGEMPGRGNSGFSGTPMD